MIFKKYQLSLYRLCSTHFKLYIYPINTETPKCPKGTKTRNLRTLAEEAAKFPVSSQVVLWMLRKGHDLSPSILYQEALGPPARQALGTVPKEKAERLSRDSRVHQPGWCGCSLSTEPHLGAPIAPFYDLPFQTWAPRHQ